MVRQWMSYSLTLMTLIALTASLSAAEDHDHDHPSTGPNGGALVELGDEEYHAEVLLKDKTDEIVVYILDSTAKKVVPIPEKLLLLNLKVSGKPQQYKLPATPTKTDPQGASCRFVLKNEKLIHILHDKRVSAQMRVKINDRSYNGKIDLAQHHDHNHKH